MTKERDERGKILLIGGGIANFTDVAATFTGLIKALEIFRDDLKANHVSKTKTLTMLVYLLLIVLLTLIRCKSGFGGQVPTFRKDCG
jgi:hypothetical protein